MISISSCEFQENVTTLLSSCMCLTQLNKSKEIIQHLQLVMVQIPMRMCMLFPFPELFLYLLLVFTVILFMSLLSFGSCFFFEFRLFLVSKRQQNVPHDRNKLIEITYNTSDFNNCNYLLRHASTEQNLLKAPNSYTFVFVLYFEEYRIFKEINRCKIQMNFKIAPNRKLNPIW